MVSSMSTTFVYPEKAKTRPMKTRAAVLTQRVSTGRPRILTACDTASGYARMLCVETQAGPPAWVVLGEVPVLLLGPAPPVRAVGLAVAGHPALEPDRDRCVQPDQQGQVGRAGERSGPGAFDDQHVG